MAENRADRFAPGTVIGYDRSVCVSVTVTVKRVNGPNVLVVQTIWATPSGPTVAVAPTTMLTPVRTLENWHASLRS